jgi:hypothetical protein
MGTTTEHFNSLGCVAKAAGTFQTDWAFDIPADVSGHDELELTICHPRDQMHQQRRTRRKRW